MTRILLAGDWHGNTTALYRAMKIAEREACDEIIQLGDFGFEYGKPFLHRVSKAVDAFGVKLSWIDGNHENFDKLDAIGAFNSTELVEIAPGVTYLPRGTVIERLSWDGSWKRILCIGGAYSIDKPWLTPYVDWFPDEQIRYQDVERCLDVAPCDMVLSHDMPDSAYRVILTEQAILQEEDAEHFIEKNDYPDAKPNRMALEAIFQHHRPDQWFHGHYHYFYRTMVQSTQFTGLDYENQPNSYWILDL